MHQTEVTHDLTAYVVSKRKKVTNVAKCFKIEKLCYVTARLHRGIGRKLQHRISSSARPQPAQHASSAAQVAIRRVHLA